MSDLERRAREAAQQERDEFARRQEESRQHWELSRERSRAEAASKAADKVENVLGVRTSLSQWKTYDYPIVSWSEYDTTDYGAAVTTEIEGVPVYWYRGVLSARESALFSEELTLAQFGNLLEAQNRRRAQSVPKRPWYKNIFS
jgi:hypothetical protein